MDRLTVEISVKSLIACINEAMDTPLTMRDESKINRITIPYHTKRSRMGAVVIQPGDGKDFLDLPKKRLEYLAKGIIWRDAHFSGKSFIKIARENNCSRTFVQQIIQKSFKPL